MRRFFSVWLVWIVVLVFGLAIVISYFLLTGSSEAAAKADLTTLTEAVFMELDMAGQSAASAVSAADGNLISKGRAIERFLAHDDTLLTGDALQSLCDLLEIASVDVTDGEGVVTASSIPGNVGVSLIDDANISWMQDTLQNDVEQVHPDGGNSSLLLGTIPRTDRDGLLLIQVQDASVKAARAAADPGAVLSRMSFVNDDLALASGEGADGAYIMDGFYCVRGTHGGVSIIASRLLGSVYQLRNAILLALAIFMLVSLLAAMVIQLLLVGGGRRHYVVKRSFNDESMPAWLTDETTLPEEEIALIEATERLARESAELPDAPDLERAEQEAAVSAQAQKPEKKRKKKRTKQIDAVPEETEDVPEEPLENPAKRQEPEEAAPETAEPEPPALEPDREPEPLADTQAKGKRRTARRTRLRPEEAGDDAGFDKVF